MSRIAMNMPKTMAIKPMVFLGSMRSSAGFSADSAYGGVCGHIDALREEKTAMPGPFRLSGFAIRF